MKAPVVQFFVLFAIAAACLGGAYFFGKDSPTKLFTWESTIGHIDGYTQRIDKKYTKLRVKFLYNDREYKFTSTENTERYVFNERVTVMFPPGAPEKAEVRNLKRLVFLPFLLGIAGLFMGFLWILIVFRLVRGKNIHTGN